jgi:Ni/Co efflux regulator RcnB
MVAAAAALCIVVGPALSLAQEHHDEHGGDQRAAPAPPPAHANQGGPQGGFHPPTQGAQAGGYRPPYGASAQGGDQAQGRPAYQGAPLGQPGYRGAPGAYLQGYQGRGGSGGPGDRGPRPGAQAFAVGGRTFYRYHAPRYAFPGGYGGWGGHYWRRGEFLPAVFFQPNYFIGDYWSYGLWAPDYGYQWIRVGADALLINLATGEVVDVVPGVYYW